MELYESTKLAKVREELISCAKTHALYKNVIDTNGHIVFGRGEETAKILFIGEAPGFSENEKGKPFVGRSGALLEEWVKELGIGKEDYAIMNVVPIIPLSEEKKIRPPTQQEIDYFLPLTMKMINAINPELIVLLGKSAARAFGLEAMRVGETREHLGKRMHFLYHPAYHLRNGRKGLEDLAKLKALLNEKKEKKKQTSLGNF
ncbi:Uracil DNA glycosylase superfamily protein [uncultured archaeon]|nr:Uracil DNA glycosylase superfamily protein [uncultured archaeon]